MYGLFRSLIRNQGIRVVKVEEKLYYIMSNIMENGAQCPSNGKTNRIFN